MVFNPGALELSLELKLRHKPEIGRISRCKRPTLKTT
jgi:hypothetical protein